MLRKSFLIFAILCAAILIGCGKTETTSNNNSTATSGDKPTTATSTPATSTASSSGEKIGIAECDDLITKYEACVSKVPEAQRAQYESTLKLWRDTWRELAKNPLTKGTLAAACKQAAEDAKTSMKDYNCTF